MKAWMVGTGVAVMVAALVACESNATNQDAAKPAGGVTPADVQVGEGKFAANCAACHGVRGVGTKQGPPLVHKSMSQTIMPIWLSTVRRRTAYARIIGSSGICRRLKA